MEIIQNNETMGQKIFDKLYIKMKHYQCEENSKDIQALKSFIEKNKISNKKMSKLLSFKLREEVEISVKGSIFDENATNCEIVLSNKYRTKTINTGIVGTRKELENYNWSECLLNYRDSKNEFQRLSHNIVLSELRKVAEKNDKKLLSNSNKNLTNTNNGRIKM